VIYKKHGYSKPGAKYNRPSLSEVLKKTCLSPQIQDIRITLSRGPTTASDSLLPFSEHSIPDKLKNVARRGRIGQDPPDLGGELLGSQSDSHFDIRQ
jgi:hypothetical protein